MMVPFLVASAIVPSLLLIWFFHARDVYPEPQRVVWATFALGVLTILPAGAIELVENAGLKHIADPFVGGTLDGFLCAGLTEELFKYAIVVLYCMRHKEFDEPMDGIVYGSIASLGFATLENFFYVVQGGEGIAIFRAFTAVPGHAFMGAIMGYFVGQAKFTPAQRGSLMAKALFIPILLHGAYDAPLLTFQRINAEKFHTHHQVAAAGLFAIVTLGVLVFEMTWTLRLTSRLRQQQMDWSRRRWAAYYARQPQPPPPWQVGVTTLEGTLLSRGCRRARRASFQRAGRQGRRARVGHDGLRRAHGQRRGPDAFWRDPPHPRSEQTPPRRERGDARNRRRSLRPRARRGRAALVRPRRSSRRARLRRRAPTGRSGRGLRATGVASSGQRSRHVHPHRLRAQGRARAVLEAARRG